MVKKIGNDAIFKKPVTAKTNRSKKDLKIFSKKKIMSIKNFINSH